MAPLISKGRLGVEALVGVFSPVKGLLNSALTKGLLAGCESKAVEVDEVEAALILGSAL